MKTCPANLAVIWRWSRNREMQPQRRRRNGWTWPPSFLQLLFWVTIPVLASSTAFLLMPLHILYAPIAVLMGTIWLVLQIIVLTCIDPAVSNLRKSQAPAYFDASKHEHVIENLFCNICLINVLATFYCSIKLMQIFLIFKLFLEETILYKMSQQILKYTL